MTELVDQLTLGSAGADLAIDQDPFADEVEWRVAL